MNAIQIKETKMQKTMFVQQIWKKTNSWMQQLESKSEQNEFPDAKFGIKIRIKPKM